MAAPVVEYNVSTAGIALLKEKYGHLKADTPEGYQEVKEALKEVSGYRIAVEKERVSLKAEALEYGRKVDSEAKRITGLILEVEEPLKAEKKKVDDEKDRVAREKAEAERAEFERLKAEEQARKAAAEQAERDRIRKEQEAENARLAAEREALAKERAAQEAAARIEREKFEAERREHENKLAAEREVLRKEQEAATRERIAREAKEKAEREARERVEREKAQAEAAALKAVEEKKIAAERAPDKQKLAEFADTLADIQKPNLESEWAQWQLERAVTELGHVVDNLRKAANCETAAV
jgi:hypothetical protein